MTVTAMSAVDLPRMTTIAAAAGTPTIATTTIARHARLAVNATSKVAS
jgi:hypothetical protein